MLIQKQKIYIMQALEFRTTENCFRWSWLVVFFYSLLKYIVCFERGLQAKSVGVLKLDQYRIILDWRLLHPS